MKAVIFDFDGLILDTESAWFQAYHTIYAEHEVVLPIDLWVKGVGTYNAFDPHKHLEQALGQSLSKEELEQRFQTNFKGILQGTELREGVVQYLESAREMGLRIGLASSSPNYWVEGYLNDYGIRHYFETLCTSDDVQHVKPDPELYLLALKRLEVEAKDAVAFEDSSHGAHAAVQAGVTCVIVPNSVTKLGEFPHYHYRINSMADQPLQELLERIKRDRA